MKKEKIYDLLLTTLLTLRIFGVKKTLMRILQHLQRLRHPLLYPMITANGELTEISDFYKTNADKLSTDYIEFVCPFWRGDVLIALQVAFTAAAHGRKIRIHVSKGIFPWVQDFPYADYIKAEPVEIGVPYITEKTAGLYEAIKKVSSREDFSGLLVCPLPMKSLPDMEIDLVQFMLMTLGLPADTPLVAIRPYELDDTDLTEYLGQFPAHDVVLLHPYGGWETKSMTEEVVRTIYDVAHSKDLKIVQIGGSADKRFEFFDGYLMKNLSLKNWHGIFKKSKALIGVDSWTAHFASIAGLNHAVVYGCTESKYIESSRHYKNQNGSFIAFEPNCNNYPCFSTICKYNKNNCAKMSIDTNVLSVWLDSLTTNQDD